MIILRTWSFRKDVKKKIVFPFPRQKINLRQHFEKDILPFALPPQFFLCLLSQSLSPFPHITAIVLPPEPKLPYSNMIGFWLSSQNPHFPCSQNELPARKKTTGRKKSAGEGKYTVLKGLLFEIVVNMCAFMFTCGIENSSLKVQWQSSSIEGTAGEWDWGSCKGWARHYPQAGHLPHVSLCSLMWPQGFKSSQFFGRGSVGGLAVGLEPILIHRGLVCLSRTWVPKWHLNVPSISEQMLRIPN